MYIKLNSDGYIDTYPYNPTQLRLDNPTVSFPSQIPEHVLAEWGVFPVTSTPRPNATYLQNVLEKTPELVEGVWTQVWEVKDIPLDQVAVLHEQLRSEAYRNESDPLFFKWQRGEIEKQVWLDKVAEIKARYE